MLFQFNIRIISTLRKYKIIQYLTNFYIYIYNSDLLILTKTIL